MVAPMPPPILPRSSSSEQREAQIKQLRKKLYRNFAWQGACVALGYFCAILVGLQILELLRGIQ